jgi:hypothetical protein
MSTIQEQLFTQLSGVGTAGTRVYPLVAQTQTQTTNDYVTYQRLTTPTLTTMSGNVPITETHFQIDCFSLEYLKANALADAVIASMASWTVPQAVLQVAEPIDAYEDATRQFRVILEFKVWHYGA